MSSYPSNARAAQLKCLSCNAPVVRTVDERFVCVECGTEPIVRNDVETTTASAD